MIIPAPQAQSPTPTHTPALGSSKPREAERGSCWRPILSDELPYLTALGMELKRLRKAAGLTQPGLAEAALISTSYLERLEAGTRRTRPATLARIVSALRETAPELAPDDLLDSLVATAGPALGRDPSSREADQRRYERRRKRREAQRRRERREQLQGLVTQALDVTRRLA